MTAGFSFLRRGLRGEARADSRVDRALLALLACPRTRRPLREEGGRLAEPVSGASYSIENGIPLLIDGAGPGIAEEAFAGRYDEVIRSPQMRALYGDSGYFNVGLWDGAPASLAQACDAMVDALAASVPEGARVILDIGCGVGAGTVRLQGAFPDAAVVGVNISLWQLLEARRRGLRRAAVSDAARLGILDGVADAVIACESPQHFDTRADFLAEALRVLRPGGTIALADMLFHDEEPVGRWMLPEENRVSSPADYARLLEHAGFAAVEVSDVTETSWRPYCREMERVFAGNEEALRRIEESLSRYVLAFARKPPA
jgi:ubiquinone/menaquinone biosynthesis C-methylase UbiE/uncharacterized protein YbaR (Trm112 family)